MHASRFMPIDIDLHVCPSVVMTIYSYSTNELIVELFPSLPYMGVSHVPIDSVIYNLW